MRIWFSQIFPKIFQYTLYVLSGQFVENSFQNALSWRIPFDDNETFCAKG